MSAPFIRQQAMAASRAVRPEDSASNISAGSWQPIDAQDLELPPGDLDLPHPPAVDIDNKVKPDQAETPSKASSYNKQQAPEEEPKGSGPSIS